MNDLQHLVAQRMAELGLSYRRAAARSDGLVSHATLNSIVAGRHTFRLDPQTVVGIAKALNVTEARVRRAAKIAETAPPTEFVLPARAHLLTARDRQAVLGVIEALLAAANPPARRRTGS